MENPKKDKLTKTIRVSDRTHKRLQNITFSKERYDDVINLLLDMAWDRPEYHKRLQA